MKIKPNARPQVVIKNQTELKRPYAYDKFGNLWDLENAINEDVRVFYLDPKQKIPLVNKFNGKVYSPHWAIKSNVEINHKGVKLNSSNLIDESIEHLNFKHKILKQGFFDWKGYRIKINEASEEFRIYEGNMFRADVKASMLDGTPIFIEVVKTSELSEKKEKFINENEFTTFVIYIDNAGNQINNKFNIIGNKELVKLNERIQDGQGKISDLRIKIDEHKSKIRNTQEVIRKRRRTVFPEAIDDILQWDRERYRESVSATKNIESELQEKYSIFEKKLQRKVNKIENQSEIGIGQIRRNIKDAEKDFNNASKYILEDIKNIREVQSRIKKGYPKIQEINEQIKYAKG